MQTYQEILQQLHSAESQLRAYQQFKHDFEIVEIYLQTIEGESEQSQYLCTIKALIKWLDWFITEIEYEEGVLIFNVNYINRRLNNYPAIELELAERRRELNERLANQDHNE